MATATVSYEGCNFFRQRIVLATLSGRPVRIKNIRASSEEPGIQDFEASFLRIVDKITNGSKIEINETGTVVLYKPGILIGGSVNHACSLQRALGYYLEGIIPLSPFCKNPLQLTLQGVTNGPLDPSVDTIKYVSIQLFKKFGIAEGYELKINKRGAPPDGGGEVYLSCPVARNMKPVQLVEEGKVRRLRGTAYTMKVAPSFANRMVDAARKILNEFVSDIYIYTDHCKGAQSGNSPGFGLALMAESTTGTMITADVASNPKGLGTPLTPEDLGQTAALKLLQGIYQGGCVDSLHQGLCLVLMTLGQMDVSKVLLGYPTTYTIHYLRHLKDFFNVTFKIDTKAPPGEGDGRAVGSNEKFIFSCVGVGFTNLGKSGF